MHDQSEHLNTSHEDTTIRPSAIIRFRTQLKQFAITLQPRQLRPRFDESDVVQDVMMIAGTSFDEFSGRNKKQLLKWLRSILENRFNDLCRFHRRQKRDVSREFIGDSIDHAVSGDQSKRENQIAMSESIAKALQVLPERTQSVIRMKSFENKTYAEISEHLGCTPEAARKLWVRGLKDLRKVVENDPEASAQLPPFWQRNDMRSLSLTPPSPPDPTRSPE